MSETLIKQAEATAANRRIFFTIFDDADGVTPKAGATGRMRISKGGASSFGQQSITGATNATPVVLTMAAAPANGSVVQIAGVLGNTAANGYRLTKNRTSTTCELTDFAGANIAGNGAYTGGGTLDVAEIDSVNAIVEYAPAGYYLELDAATEVDLLGRGRVSKAAVSGYLAVPPQFFDVVAYDPNSIDKTNFKLDKTDTYDGIELGKLLSAQAFNIDTNVGTGVITFKGHDGTTLFTRTLTRAALNAIISAVP